uniref:Putative mttA/hcf106 family protein n=1 Tax=Linum usitatissimum TaxID=4006 RepID=A0A172MLJ4_LINUS|nr:putative mttA/hcf106 family protein [Linum usitatissimum]
MAMATLITTPATTTSTRARLLLHPQRPPYSAPNYCPSFGLSSSIPQQCSSTLSQRNGLKLMDIPIATKFLHHRGRKGKRKGKFDARASLFGVGAPEALVIGVVALLVFGPKGLAEENLQDYKLHKLKFHIVTRKTTLRPTLMCECVANCSEDSKKLESYNLNESEMGIPVARNLGKTLRAFQPTIRELQEVSREFKSTLEKEIGLDGITNSTTQTTNLSNSTPTAPAPPSPPVTSSADSPAESEPNGTPTADKAYTSEEYLKITEEQLKKASSSQQQAEVPAAVESQPDAKATEENGEQQQVQTLVAAESQVAPPQAQPTAHDDFLFHNQQRMEKLLPKCLNQ